MTTPFPVSINAAAHCKLKQSQLESMRIKYKMRAYKTVQSVNMKGKNKN